MTNQNKSAVSRLLVAGYLLLAALPALAEKADRGKPVNLEADTVAMDDVKQISTYQGNVVLTQGTLEIHGDKMIVKQGAGGFEQGTIYGKPASFKQKRDGLNEYIEGFAERIEYDAKADKAQLFIKARMKRNQDDVRGNYISYDARTEFFQVIGGAKEAGTPAGRVHAVIQPKSKPADNPAAP